MSNQSGSDAESKLFSPTRRRLLMGVGGVLALQGVRPALAQQQPTAIAEQDQIRWQRQPFYGRHQAGIVTPQQATMMLVAFDVIASDRAELIRLLKLLTERFAFLTQGGRAPEVDGRLPPLDSGILGPEIYPDNLTLTLSVGNALFDTRFGLQQHKPRRLQQMVRFPNDALDASLCHGDLLLQICANTNETVIHALRDIIKHTPDLLSVR